MHYAPGQQASTLLHNAVAEWAASEIAECPENVKIVVRIYANLKGLGDVCARAGVVSQSYVIEDFARGFTRGKTLFDFIDVGSGKDRADGKISGKCPIRLRFLQLLTRGRNVQTLPL